MESEKPLVSICCITYNHEKYVRDAIEGFLMQCTDFKFEIVIHDDASTDKTVSILKDYEKKYPQLIRVIYEMENQYSKFENVTQFFFPMMRKELKGKYVAVCEGDDYWIDVNKLQTQIDYMESHPDCVMTGHDAIMINCKTGEKRRMRRFQEGDLTVEDVISASIPTASFIYKKEMLDISGFFLETGEVGDYPLQLFCATEGKIHYFDKAMSIHLVLTENAWSSRQANDLYSFCKSRVNNSYLLEKFNDYTDKRFDILIKREISSMLNQVVPRANGLALEQFHGICERLDQLNEHKKHKYYVELVKNFRQYYDLTYLDSNIIDFIKKNRYVLIWGAGYYGKRLSEQFQSNRIEFSGFVVSDNQSEEECYQKKRIWRISQIPYDKAEIGVVIAVRREIKDEVIEVIQNIGIERYIYPFEVGI